MRLWIDDIREAPDSSWEWIKSVGCGYDAICENALNAEEHGLEPEEVLVSLDHDAGGGEYGLDYIELLNLLERLVNFDEFFKNYILKKVTFHIHSMNPVGVENMRRIIRKNGWREV